MTEGRLKHLEFIQGVINRLSTNSFLLKGWSVVLVAALLGLGSLDDQNPLVFLALMPVLVLWGLDGYFLWQERLYRLLYDQVRQKEISDVDFCMSPAPIVEHDKGWLSATFSPTLITFHGVLIVAIGVVAYVVISSGTN